MVAIGIYIITFAFHLSALVWLCRMGYNFINYLTGTRPSGRGDQFCDKRTEPRTRCYANVENEAVIHRICILTFVI